MSNNERRTGQKVESLRNLADSMASLQTVIHDSIARHGRIELIGSSVVLDGLDLIDFSRHLAVVSTARKTRYLTNGLRRMASKDGGQGRRARESETSDAHRRGDSDDRNPGTDLSNKDHLSRSWKSLIGARAVSADENTMSVNSLNDIFFSIKQFGDLVRELEVESCHLLLRKEDIDTRSSRDRKFARNISLISEFDGHLHREIGRQNQAAAAADGRLSGPRPKLTAADRDQVRSLYEAGHLTVAEIATEFGVGRGTVYRALEEPDSGRGATPQPRERRKPAVPRGAFQDRRGNER